MCKNKAVNNPYKMCLPKALISVILNLYHNIILIGSHAGIHRTLQNIGRSYTWKNMKTEINCFVKMAEDIHGKT